MITYEGLSDLEVLERIIHLMGTKGNPRFSLYYKSGKWKLTIE